MDIDYIYISNYIHYINIYAMCVETDSDQCLDVILGMCKK